ncbi:hypothetical protein [Aeromonas enteropelogenes]|uniref:hypothetical protein n=1 Tax=Aeromonas enteropelogenes TaxID=29489 RepID=UPI003BA10F37
MKWSAHLYLTNTNDGLMKRLEPTSTDKASLEKLKDTIRIRTKGVFTEAKDVVKMLASRSRSSTNIQLVESAIRKTNLRYLDNADVAYSGEVEQ